MHCAAMLTSQAIVFLKNPNGCLHPGRRARRDAPASVKYELLVATVHGWEQEHLLYVESVSTVSSSALMAYANDVLEGSLIAKRNVLQASRWSASAP